MDRMHPLRQQRIKKRKQEILFRPNALNRERKNKSLTSHNQKL